MGLASPNAIGKTQVLDYPTDLFTIVKLKNPWYGVPELHKIRRSPDFEALKW